MTARDERGIALILALLILTLLVALILEFDAEARREYRDAAAFRDHVKVSALTRAGVQAARAVLLRDHKMEKLANQRFDALTDLWALPIVGYQLGDGVLSAQIEDETGKLNLNELANVQDPKQRDSKLKRLKRLLELLQVRPDVAEAIADWVDTDDVPEPNGAESAYYQTLRPPYMAANAPLQTLSELYLIKGMTKEIVQRLEPYVTVYPQNGADGRVNLNTAPPIVIQALDPRITPGMAAEIVQGRPYRSTQDLDQISTFEPIAKELRVLQAYAVTSNHFSARIGITVNEVNKTMYVVLRRDEATGDSSVLFSRIE
ncbi:MAG TPA: type II secretion system minor pseudopilin GspK [Nitrospiraceae bacterium]|jgi:general secretion pathway protein K|nr:type II secretion system minor pseudopilin GspK [Nitrospiraceae bacterium]